MYSRKFVCCKILWNYFTWNFKLWNLNYKKIFLNEKFYDKIQPVAWKMGIDISQLHVHSVCISPWSVFPATMYSLVYKFFLLKESKLVYCCGCHEKKVPVVIDRAFISRGVVFHFWGGTIWECFASDIVQRQRTSVAKNRSCSFLAFYAHTLMSVSNIHWSW